MSRNNEPKMIDIPNFLFDFGLSYLTGEELKILMALARVTYDYDSDECKGMLTATEIKKMSGLSNKGLHKILDSLFVRNIIFKIQLPNQPIHEAQYAINIPGIFYSKDGEVQQVTYRDSMIIPLESEERLSC